MGMPPRLDTVQFSRKINDEERFALLTAGGGNITIGFKEIIRVYIEMYNLGFKRDMSVFDFVVCQDIPNIEETIGGDPSAS